MKTRGMSRLRGRFLRGCGTLVVGCLLWGVSGGIDSPADEAPALDGSMHRPGFPAGQLGTSATAALDISSASADRDHYTLLTRESFAVRTVRAFGDSYDLAVFWVCNADWDYLPVTGDGPGPCLGMTYDPVPEICGPNSFSGVDVEILESETNNCDGTVTVIVQAGSADGSDLLPNGMECAPGDDIDICGCDLAKQDAGGPGIPGDPLDPDLGVSPFEILEAKAVIFGAGGSVLLSFDLNSAGTTRRVLKDRFTVGGCGSVVVTALQFRYLISVPLPVGACCFADDNCSDCVTAADCFNAGGSYQGDGTDCKAGCAPAGDDPLLEPGSKESPPASPCDCAVCTDPEDGLSIDPVYLFSGEFYEAADDLGIRGRGRSFGWGRKYRSRIGPDTGMGNGWDFGYNVSLEQSGPDLKLHDGNSRVDTYALQPDGSWADREFFREIIQNPDNSFTLTFPDTGTWLFRPLDGSPQQGKLNGIIERNGNTLALEYDAQGRLVTIHDTLDTPAHNRDIILTYNADGFIESVSDYTGRQVTYEYYDGIEPGGNFGDLKSVTTPAVVGTPHGNDFPSGKTTVYTYSTGFADERLNHDLLTITDPKGQTYLINEYAHTIDAGDPRHTENPADFNFDRLVRQTWGDPGDVIDLVYVPQTPEPDNNFAVIKTIGNDRVGNVKEFFFDDRNRGVIQRDYTGRAPDPDAPTTETDNRPENPLRPEDPPFFETRYEYNDDSLITQITQPNGNVTQNVYELELDPNAPRRSRGNLREVHHLPGPLGGDQIEIIELFEYDADQGGCCGTNFVTQHTDGRGNLTQHFYDAAGNRTQTIGRIPSIVEDFEYNAFGQMTAHILPDNGSGHRRRDEFTYHDSGPQLGYLEQQIIDAGGFALTTTYEYDSLGRATRQIDPRGHDTLSTYNALDQVVRQASREVTDGSGLRYETDTFYDANDNVVRVDIHNIDDQGVLQANTHFSTVYEHEILNRQSSICQEVGSANLGPGDLDCSALPAGEFIVTEFEYDPNRNRTLVRSGEATNGNQPTNLVRTLYDERDLVFHVIRAEADADQSSTQFDYDGNRNRTEVHQGLEDQPRVTSYAFDGYDRLVSATGPMGNVATVHYDANGNRPSERLDGELTDTTPGTTDGNVRLWELSNIYDAMDRLTRRDIAFFDPQTQAPIGDGLATTEIEYSDNSQVTRDVDDNGLETLTTYDTANRQSVTTDHKGNTNTYAYDDNSNALSVTEVEKSDLGNPDETFVTSHTYDNLDRLTKTVDNDANTVEYGHDSRNNRTLMIDTLRPVNPTDPGNVVRSAYDGLNRLTTTTRFLTDDGTGSGAPAGTIVTTQTWDDSSRLIAATDDRGNTSSYAYDALDRPTAVVYADGTSHAFTYDVHDNTLTVAEPNGSAVSSTYDLANREVLRNIIPGPGVSNDTTFESYEYDGLNRLVRAEDDDAVVVVTYNSMSNVTSDTINGQSTSGVYDGVGNQTQCTYPGGRTIDCTFDELNRMQLLSDGRGTIATYDYIGPRRIERRTFGNNTQTDLAYDNVRRIVGTTHLFDPAGANTVIDQRTYAWDRMFNKTQRADLRAGGPQLTHDYTYDSVYRLAHTTATDPTPSTVRDTDYTLDGAGNRQQVTGNPDPGIYTMNAALPEPADSQMNQYTTTPLDDRLYDLNGNLTDLAGLAEITYDYRNQMVEYHDLVTRQRQTYGYDALGRRISKILDADGDADETRFFYDGRQVVEEQDGAGTTLATYLYGRYLDEVLQMQRGVDDRGIPQDYYFHPDDLYSVMAVSDATGDVVERYEYGDYGQPRIMDADGCNVSCPFDVNDDGQVGPFDLANLLACWGPVAGGVCQCLDIDNSGNIGPFDLASLLASWGPCSTPSSGVGNPYLFTGRRFDPETGWYYYRARYMDPHVGRFTTRDPIGAWGDNAGLGNAFTLVGNSPATAVDPFGLKKKYVFVKVGKSEVRKTWGGARIGAGGRYGHTPYHYTAWAGGWGMDDSRMWGYYRITPDDNGGAASITNTYEYDGFSPSFDTHHFVHTAWVRYYSCNQTTGRPEHRGFIGSDVWGEAFQDGPLFAHMRVTIQGEGSKRVILKVEVMTGVSDVAKVIDPQRAAPFRPAAATKGTFTIGSELITPPESGSRNVFGDELYWEIKCECVDD